MPVPRRKAPLVYKFAQLFQHLGKRPSEIGAKLDEALRGFVDQSQGIPAGYGDAIPPQIVAGSPGSKGAESTGWMSQTARPSILTASPGNPTGKFANEGSGGALMRADATIAQGIVSAKGDILTHDGSTAERLPVGPNDYVLLTDSTQATGLKWESAAAIAGRGGRWWRHFMLMGG